jgi:hypothetical protein
MRKGHEIVVVSFFTKNHAAPLIVFPTILLFAFVLCQGESGSGASLGACSRSSECGSCWLVVLTDHWPPITDHWTVVRPMSDRESVRDGGILVVAT